MNNFVFSCKVEVHISNCVFRNYVIRTTNNLKRNLTPTATEIIIQLCGFKTQRLHYLCYKEV